MKLNNLSLNKLLKLNKFHYNIYLDWKFLGSSRLSFANLYLHKYYNFTEFIFETVEDSLPYSCKTTINWQGIKLP